MTGNSEDSNNEEQSQASTQLANDQVLEQGSKVAPYIFFRGTVQDIPYRNQDSGFAVMKCEAESDLQTITGNSTTLVGIVPETISTGSSVIARGVWDVHPKFGKQFRARSITETRPTSKEAIERYLGSGAIKGFGSVLAERLVEAFGEDTLRVLDEEPDKLSQINGIGQKKLDEIKQAWREKSNLREVMLFFQNYGISVPLAQRIYREYKDRSVELVKKNPYLLATDVWGIGFKTADQIAISLGLDPESSARLVAGIQHTVKSAADDGHCFLPREILLSKAANLLEVNNHQLLEDALFHSISQTDLLEEQQKIYLPALHQAETDLAKLIARKTSGKEPAKNKIPAEILSSISEKRMSINIPGKSAKLVSLSPEQKQALTLISEHSITVITGGPGCGKTTVVRALAKMLKLAGLELKLAAPTGRAAQRLSEVCDMQASTIHRLLKFDPSKRSFIHDHKDPLELDALILDECSMIDIPLAASVLRAIPSGARLIIVGDADQLPSVGPGRFLADLLSVKTIPRVELTTLFRREEESSITHIAHSINAGEVPSIPEPDGQTKSDSYFLKAAEPEEAAKLIERLLKDQLTKRFSKSLGISQRDIMVLTPMNKGDLGVLALNQRLQKSLIQIDSQAAKVKCGHLTFCLGDRVIQRVNNYNIDPAGVFNGDQGEIIGIDAAKQTLYVKLWDGREIEYSNKNLYQLDLAYALTIHRSQGSEVPVVVLALHDTHNIMLERQLLYTAITRAKRLLVIVGTRRALKIAVKRLRSRKRHSSLAELIEKNISEATIC